jgi:hypothetical protein
MTDPVLRELALKEFAEMARQKFDSGIEEHNPNGDRNLSRLDPLDLIKQQKLEIIDAWYYTICLEKKLESGTATG